MSQPWRLLPVVKARSIFNDEQKQKIEAEHPNETKLEIYKRLDHMWNKLSKNEKAYYAIRAKDKERKIRMKDGIKILEEAREKKRIRPYSIFLSEKHNQLKLEHPEMTLTERTDKISKDWSMLSHNEKMVYINKSKKINRNIREYSDDEYDEIKSPYLGDYCQQ